MRFINKCWGCEWRRLEMKMPDDETNISYPAYKQCAFVGRIRRQPPSGIEDMTINLPDVSQQIV